MSLSASDALLVEGGEAALDGWSVVAVEGADRERFLHSQLTSNVAALAFNDSQQTALLDRGGRLQAFGFLHKRTHRIDLLLPDEAVDPALDLLEAHIIAEDVTLRRLEVPRLRLLLGAEAVRLRSSLPDDETVPIEGWGSRGCVTWSKEIGGLRAIGEAELESRRLLAGPPRWGREARTGMLVHETLLLETAVSSDKGCYLGQETVAKVASGRGAARAPVALEIVGGGAEAVEVKGPFAWNGHERAGEVLGMAQWDGAAYLVASAIRELRVEGLEVELCFGGGREVGVVVRPLPVLSTPAPHDWALQLHLVAVDEFSRDREDEAVAVLERAVAVCPEHADSYESLGVILGRQERYDEAIELMHRLLAVDPLSVMAHSNLSLYYMKQGRIEDAEREAGAAARAKVKLERSAAPALPSAEDEARARAEDLERRAEMFRQVLALDPGDALGNFGLGELLAEQGRHEEAVRHLEAALVADPKYSAALLALGKAREALGESEAAIQTYRDGITVAAAKGDLSTANQMQARLAALTQ